MAASSLRSDVPGQPSLAVVVLGGRILGFGLERMCNADIAFPAGKGKGRGKAPPKTAEVGASSEITFWCAGVGCVS